MAWHDDNDDDDDDDDDDDVGVTVVVIVGSGGGDDDINKPEWRDNLVEWIGLSDFKQQGQVDYKIKLTACTGSE